MSKHLILTVVLVSATSLSLGWAAVNGTQGEHQIDATVVQSEQLIARWFHRGGVAAKFDQDEYPDVVTLHQPPEDSAFYLTFYHGNGKGQWTEVESYEAAGMPEGFYDYGLTAVDVNGDGYLDVIAGGIHYGDPGDTEYNIITFFNTGSGGFTCTGDVTGDGQTGVDDLLGVIGDWGCTEEGLPD